MAATSDVEVLLETLMDGEWHSYDEICEKLGLSEDRMVEIARFWAKYDFIKLDESQKRMRMLEDTQKLLLAERKFTFLVKGQIKSLRMVEGELNIRGEELCVEWIAEERKEPLSQPGGEVCLEVLKFLKDVGGWLNISKISEKIRIEKGELRNILRLLAKHNFVTLDEQEGKAKAI
jgi:DNA-directed RNA polymerase specialized sigma subunit